MEDPPFTVSAQVNRECFANTLLDSGCTTYGAIDSRFARKHQLTRVPISPRNLGGFTDGLSAQVKEIAHLSLDIAGSYQSSLFLYVVPKLGYDIILGTPWLRQQQADIIMSGEEPKLVYKNTGLEVLSEYGKEFAKASVLEVSASAFNTYTSHRQQKKGAKVFTASLADIEKALRVRQPTDPKTKLPEHYHAFLDVFDRKIADTLPQHRGPEIDHKIVLETVDGKPTEPPWGPLYGMSRGELLVLRRTLTELLDKGFIRVSNSPAGAPVLFAKKPGGGLRFCVDYRALNKLTKKDRYPLPLINETLERIGKARWFTKLDVNAAFYKLRINEGDEWKTAFRTRYGLFEWLVTPFGLANAPSTFQRYINWTLRDFLDEFASAYLDDILIFTSGSLKKHREHVAKVLQRLKDAGLQLDIDKCEFEVESTKYLGFIIEAGKGIRMDPAKVKAIVEWEAPRSVKGVRAFIGFANFYRRFIKQFSEIARPLTELTKKDAVFKWSEEANAAFERLKKMFTSAPILMQFDPDRETVVETDSSGYVVGGLLSQYDDDGVLRPCAYFSKRNTPAECNYEIYDKELLAIVRCLEEWSPELRSTKEFKIITDHKNLKYFATMRRLTERQIRWAEILSQFNFTITYRPGKEGILPDTLSRREQDMPKGVEDERLRHREMLLLKPGIFNDADHGIIRVVPIRTRAQSRQQEISTESPPEDAEIVEPELQGESSETAGPEPQGESSETIELDPSTELPIEEQWNEAKEHDEALAKLTTAVREGQRTFPAGTGVKVSISECSLNTKGELLFRDRRWVPDSEPLRTRILQEIHDSALTGHPGRESMYALLARQFFWPNCADDVRRFVRNCDSCGANAIWRSRRQGLLKPLPIPDRCWHELSMDFIVELPESDGCKNIMVTTDRLGKGVIFEPCERIDTETVANKFIWGIYRHHGPPRAIVSDRGKQFVGRMWKRFCQLMRITRRLSTAYHPETDGSTENANQKVEAFIRIFCNYAQSDWKELLPSAQLAWNNRDSASTGVSAFFLNHGYHVDPLDWPEEPQETQGATPIQQAERIVSKIKQAEEWAQTAMANAQQQQEEYANRHRSPAPRYQVEDKVWLDLRNIKTNRPCKKLDAKNAKFTITECIGSHAYRLNTPPGIDNVFHTYLLRPAHDDPFPSQKRTDWQPPALMADNDNEEWLVEEILRERTVKVGRGKRRELLVKWIGYARPTWEPASALDDTIALNHYEDRLREAQNFDEGGDNVRG